jgi:hypothetical protein
VNGESRGDGAVAGVGASVVIVGAGVSGCACGATLAAAGIDVTLVSSALDLVGLPSYGPGVWFGADCIERCMEALDELPPVLREVWVDACIVPEGGPSCVVVDRRRLSVETKRALEGFGGLKFRQGLVVELRAGRSREGLAGGSGKGAAAAQEDLLELETAFGEVLPADVVVLAPGLGLGGRLVVGEQEMMGGRYGETPSDHLMESLSALGVEWVTVTELVGARFVAAKADVEGSALWVASPGEVGTECVESPDPIPLRRVLSRVREVERARRGEGRGPAYGAGAKWRSDLPPSPYFATVGVGAGFKCGMGTARVAAGGVWDAVPDGLATGEAYVVPRASGEAELLLEVTESRPAQSIRGLAIGNVDSRGRFVGRAVGESRVWVAGRAAGAGGYVESLRSGVKVGRCVMEELGAAYGPRSRRGLNGEQGRTSGAGGSEGAAGGRP